MRPRFTHLRWIRPNLLLLLLLAFGCGGDWLVSIYIDTPENGLFTADPTVTVTGHVQNFNPDFVADVTVNGASVLPLAAGDTFSAVVTLDAVAIINPIVAEVRFLNAKPVRDLVTVMAGDFLPDGSFSGEGVALRLNDSGIDKIEPLVQTLVNAVFDLADLLGQGPVQVNECLQEICLFGCVCLARANTFEVLDASFGPLGLSIDSMTNEVDATLLVDDLEVDYTVNLTAVFTFDCTGEFTDTQTSIDGGYALSPDPVDPEIVDVNQSSGPNVSFANFMHQFTGGVCDFPVIGDLIQLLAGDIQPQIVTAMQNTLDDPDGGGPLDSPIADGIEVALQAIELAGPIGMGLGVDLAAPLFAVTEDVDGITFGSDASLISLTQDPAAVDLLASYDVPTTFPTFSALAPNGLPYDLGMCISMSAFNQLLKAHVEGGLLISSVTELDLGGGPQLLTGGLLAALVPQFQFVDPLAELRLDLYPTMAPIVTGEPGPAGEMALLRVPHLRVTLVPLDSEETVLLELALDIELGLDADFLDGELVFLLGEPIMGGIDYTITNNRILGVDRPDLGPLLPTLVRLAIPTLEATLETFPLPAFLGLDLTRVDVDRNGEFMSLFLDLVPIP